MREGSYGFLLPCLDAGDFQPLRSASCLRLVIHTCAKNGGTARSSRRATAAPTPHQKAARHACAQVPLLFSSLTPSLALSACSLGTTSESTEEPVQGVSQEEEESPKETSEPEPGPTEDALPYVEALADRVGREEVEAGLEFPHPDHPAHGYLQHQADLVHANIVSGFTPETESMELAGDNAQIRRGSGGCATFGDFLFLDGLITDFQVNGNLVSEHFVPGSAEDSRDGSRVSVSSSCYSFESNHFSLILDVETGSDTGVTVTSSLHVGEDSNTSPLDPFVGVIGQEHLARGRRGRSFSNTRTCSRPVCLGRSGSSRHAPRGARTRSTSFCRSTDPSTIPWRSPPTPNRRK